MKDKTPKYNDNSTCIKDWSLKKLKDEAISYDELINGEMPCFGRKDTLMYDFILLELARRGIKVGNKLTFH